MNIIDIILAILLLVGVVRGFIKGFIFEVAVLGILFLGLYAGFHFAEYVSPYVLKIVKLNPLTLHYVSFFVMFLVVAVAIFFLAKLFEGLVNVAALGIFNKIAGAVFGGIKYVLVISVALYFYNKVDTNYNWLSPDKKANSYLYYPLMKIAPELLPVIREAGDKIEYKITPPSRSAMAGDGSTKSLAKVDEGDSKVYSGFVPKLHQKF